MPGRRALSVVLLLIAAVTTTTCTKRERKPVGGELFDILVHLPKDSAGVYGLAWSSALTSELFETHDEFVLGSLSSKLESIYRTCKIDVRMDVHTLVIASAASGLDGMLEVVDEHQSSKHSVAAVKGRIEQKSVEDCILKMGGHVDDGRYSLDGGSFHAYWPEPNLVLLSRGLSPLQLKNATFGGSVLDNETVMGHLKKVDASVTAWAVAQLPESASEAMRQLNAPIPKWAYCGITLTNRLSAHVGIVFDSSDDAGAAHAQLQMLLAMGKGMKDVSALLQDVESGVADSDVVIDIALSSAQFKEIQTLMN